MSLKRDIDWIQLIATLATMFSYVIVAISIFQIPTELGKNGEVPLRIYLLLAFAFTVWGLVAYFSDQPIWKSVAQYITSTLLLASLMLFGAGLKDVIGHVSGGEVIFSYSRSLAVLGVGATLLFVFGKLLGSKWLK